MIMETKLEYELVINRQIEKNIFRNIFSADQVLLINEDIFKYIKENFIIDSKMNEIINYCASSLLFSLYRYNQYINFSEKDIIRIKSIYKKTIENIKTSNEYERIEKNHYDMMKEFLIDTNSFLQQININDIKTYVNQEYTAEFQLNTLNLSINNLEGPVLDIGCGENHYLVDYLNSKDIETYGIDRYNSKNNKVIKSDFLTYDYHLKQWKNILSNMAFSNHFNKHLLYNDDKVEDYCKAYNNIISSLAVGGKFTYAPSIIGIERMIDKKIFLITNEEVAYGLFRTSIIKLR